MAYWTSASTHKARWEAVHPDQSEPEQKSGDEDDEDNEPSSPVKPKPKSNRKGKKVVVQEPEEDEAEVSDEERSELVLKDSCDHH
jgi:hypothetical protein